MSVSVRRARPEDLAALAALVAASYRAAFAGILGEAGLARRSPDHFLRRFTDELPHLGVAECPAGRAVGMNEVRGDTLDMLFVAPTEAGRGVGALLLADAEGRGAARLECFEANGAARRFYARHGWRETEARTRPFAGALHAFVLMEKPGGEPRP